MSQYQLLKHVARISPAESITRYFGPADNCEALVWSALTDFANWPAWMPGLASVQQLDSGTPGRGSSLELHGRFAYSRCLISYWDPGTRLDLNFSARFRRAGYSFTVQKVRGSGQVELNLELELEFRGFLRPIGNLLARREKRKAEKLIAGYCGYLQSLLG